MRKHWLVAGVLLLSQGAHPAVARGPLTEIEIEAPCASAAETIFDVPALIATPLNARVLKSAEKDGIVTEEVMFHSEMDGEKSVDIFAFFSYPRAVEKPLPAFIWNQAGLGQASTYWTELGARRGYATLCIDFPLPGYRSTGNYPINAGLDLTADPKQAPIYHGAVALLKAVSFLESRPEVDKNRIGMAGSSWGGFFTTLMVGLDSRLKVGSSMFGTGSLQLGNSFWDSNGKSAEHDAAYRARWKSTLDPAWRLQNSKTPIAWFTGTNDTYSWMPALMQSYAMAAGPKHLTLMPNWDHGLPPIGDEQVFAWLDAHLKNAPAFLQVSPITLQSRSKKLFAVWNFSGPRKAQSAELILSYGDGNWSRRYWSTLAAKIIGQSCEVEIPRSNQRYSISGAVIDETGFRYSTPIIMVPAFSKNARAPSLDYDGASMWGDFEEAQIHFLKGEGWPAPPTSTQAKTGFQAAALAAGKTVLPPLGFTAGVLHRLSAWMKADQATVVTVEVGGSYDGKPQSIQKQFPLGIGWTQINLDFAPPQTLSGETHATITVPEGASVVMDNVTFRPVYPKS